VPVQRRSNRGSGIGNEDWHKAVCPTPVTHLARGILHNTVQEHDPIQASPIGSGPSTEKVVHLLRKLRRGHALPDKLGNLGLKTRKQRAEKCRVVSFQAFWGRLLVPAEVISDFAVRMGIR
jgi:hypothetical protein